MGGLEYTWPFVVAAIGGYLLGSIPFGLVLTRLAGLGDIRQIGSGNIGATNVLRTGNKALAALTLLLDGAKGAVAVLIAGRYGPDMAVLAGVGAFLGHLFPVWLKFNGGKGMATFLGTLLALHWPAGALACLTWLAVAFTMKYSSAASLSAAALAPFFALMIPAGQVPAWQRFEAVAVMTVLVFIRHHANIRRLIARTEPKIGAGK
jgi:glycerol-3-phosphate acyltransferase PlsY